MKRIIAIVLIAVLTAGLFAGCRVEKLPYIPTGNGLHQGTTEPTLPTNPNTDSEQQLKLAYDGSQSLNPYQTGSATNKMLFALIYQPLFSVDENYQVHPILCKNYRVSKDMKTYTFYPEAATFSDGSTLTAQDVAASLLQAKESPAYQGRFTELLDVQVTEDGGVAVTMAIPYENLFILLDVPIVKASEVTAQRPIGTGPYWMEEGTNGLWLRRRESWWCRAELPVTASYIVLTEANSPTELRDAFEIGDTDLVCADPGSISYVDFRGDYELWDCESGYFLYLACNQTSAVFSNKAVRAALTHLIDRDLLVSTYYKDFAISAVLPASPQSPYYNDKLAANYDYDPERFYQAVADAELQGSRIILLVNQADGRRVRVAKEMAKMLTDAGLSVTVSALGGSSYTDALSRGDFDLHLGQTKLTANMDLSAFFNPKGSLNFGGLNDAVCYSLCQEAMANFGNYYSLHRVVMDDGMLCPILFRCYALYAARGVFDQLYPARDNLFFYSLGKDLETMKME